MLAVSVSTGGVSDADSAAVSHAVRAGFAFDPVFHVVAAPGTGGNTGYFEFVVIKPSRGTPSPERAAPAWYSAVVSCTIADGRRTLRVQITNVRTSQVLVEFLGHLTEGDPLAALVERTIRDVARTAANLAR